MYNQLDGLYRNFCLLLNTLLDMSRVLNSKCPKLKASKDYLN